MGVDCINWVEAGVFCFCRMHRDEACSECKYFAMNEAAPKPGREYLADGMPLSA